MACLLKLILNGHLRLQDCKNQEDMYLEQAAGEGENMCYSLVVYTFSFDLWTCIYSFVLCKIQLTHIKKKNIMSYVNSKERQVY